MSWVGPCNISPHSMIDGEDLLALDKICGDNMVHFISEIFHQSLFSGVLAQRLLASLAKDVLFQMQPELEVKREGDDLYVGDGKLSISIATVSPISTLIHFAVNVVNNGTPVKTVALNDFGISPKEFAGNLMEAFASEIETSIKATVKVRTVASH